MTAAGFCAWACAAGVLTAIMTAWVLDWCDWDAPLLAWAAWVIVWDMTDEIELNRRAGAA